MKNKIITIGTWIGAVALGRLMGINVVVPAISGILAYYLIKKSDHIISIQFKYPLSYLIGHTSWMIFGFVYLTTQSPSLIPDFFLIDVAISIAFILLLIMVTKKWVYISLYLYEIISLLINIEALTYATSGQARALLTHIILRIAIVVTLFLALRKKDIIEETNVGAQ